MDYYYYYVLVKFEFTGLLYEFNRNEMKDYLMLFYILCCRNAQGQDVKAAAGPCVRAHKNQHGCSCLTLVSITQAAKRWRKQWSTPVARKTQKEFVFLFMKGWLYAVRIFRLFPNGWICTFINFFVWLQMKKDSIYTNRSMPWYTFMHASLVLF